MREIKFRAWSESLHLMQTDFMLKSSGGMLGDKEGEIQNEDYVIMQHTGLKDANDDDIYEGDIIEYLDGEYSFTAIIEWGDYGWYMKGQWNGGGSDNFNFEDTSPDVIGIIGNIHENPELLPDSV